MKKEDPLDFALWKAAKPGEIHWSSPWGEGRPGWHIECSVMARAHLGDTIDIHAGGQDLTFPHHENEIAQSESYTGKLFARYWMHNGYINIDNEKMSKSLGNFVLVHDIIQKIDPQVLRFFMLSVHYRHPINFSEELIESARSGLERLRTAYSNLQHRLKSTTNLAENSELYLEKIDELKKQFEKEMDDDFNTANGISVLFELARTSNTYVNETNTDEKVLKAFIETFEVLSGVLGIKLAVEMEILDEEIEKLIEERNIARKNRDFKRADEIRDQLLSMNIILEDTRQGTRWKRGS